MKKITLIAALFLCLATITKAQTIKWPAGAASTVTFAASGTTTITITNAMSYCGSIVTTTANATIYVSVASYVKAGAILQVICTTTGTETMAFSGAIVAPTITGVAGKTWSQAFIYNGTNFYPCGAKIQIN